MGAPSFPNRRSSGCSATWCHRHAWHAELWRRPAADGRRARRRRATTSTRGSRRCGPRLLDVRDLGGGDRRPARVGVAGSGGGRERASRRDRPAARRDRPRACSTSSARTSPPSSALGAEPTAAELTDRLRRCGVRSRARRWVGARRGRRALAAAASVLRGCTPTTRTGCGSRPRLDHSAERVAATARPPRRQRRRAPPSTVQTPYSSGYSGPNQRACQTWTSSCSSTTRSRRRVRPAPLTTLPIVVRKPRRKRQAPDVDVAVAALAERRHVVARRALQRRRRRGRRARRPS